MLNHSGEKRQQADLMSLQPGGQRAARLDRVVSGVTTQATAGVSCTTSFPRECLRRELRGGIRSEAVLGHLCQRCVFKAGTLVLLRTVRYGRTHKKTQGFIKTLSFILYLRLG